MTLDAAAAKNTDEIRLNPAVDRGHVPGVSTSREDGLHLRGPGRDTRKNSFQEIVIFVP